jgi:SAM-dependent methyltransferase
LPVTPHTATAWRTYHRWNRRDERMAQLWVRPLVKHLRTLPWLGADRAVLDYGCGYFDVGLAVADRFGRADGFDTDAGAVEVARTRAKLKPSSHVYGSTDDIPRATYDLIVANSVFQYLAGDDEVLRTLRLFRTLLRPGGRGEVLLGDLIPQRYSSAKDALRSIWVACQNGVVVSMAVHLWKAAFKGGGLDLNRIAPERIAELAAAAGFDCERLPVNVTPSRRRYSYLLRVRA